MPHLSVFYDQLATLYEHSLTGITVSIGPHGILDCNPQFAELVGFERPAEIQGKRLRDFFTTETIILAEALQDKYLHPGGATPPVLGRLLRRDNKIITVRAKAIRLEKVGVEDPAIVGFWQDITSDYEALVEANLSREKLARELTEVRHQLGALKKRAVLDALQQVKPLITELLAKSHANPELRDLGKLADHLIRTIQGGEKPLELALAKLSPAETRVANLLRRGLQTKEIAAKLNIGIRTVETHRASIRRKLDLPTPGTNLTQHLQALAPEPPP